MKPQQLCEYVHEEQKLFFISSINEDRINVEANIEKQYGRARSLHKAMLAGNTNEVNSGFMYALINTNFSGWRVNHISELLSTAEKTSTEKLRLIEKYEADDFVNVGSRDSTKGEYGKGQRPARWNVKLNVNNLTKSKIFDKIEFLFRAAKTKPSNDAVNALYMAIVCPNSHGPMAKNFGSYNVESLSSMFMFVRNYQGLDLP